MCTYRHDVCLSVHVDYMLTSVSDFVSACKELQQTLSKFHSSPDISHQLNLVRILNDKLMNIERAFIHPEGLPGRPFFKLV